MVRIGNIRLSFTILFRFIAAVFVATLLFLAIWAGYELYPAFSSPCGYEQLAQVKSQDNRYVATLFLKNCGATTDFTSIIAIYDASKHIDPADKSKYVFICKGKSNINISWRTTETLVVTIPPDHVLSSGSILQKDTVWRNLKVIYKGL